MYALGRKNQHRLREKEEISRGKEYGGISAVRPRSQARSAPVAIVGLFKVQRREAQRLEQIRSRCSQKPLSPFDLDRFPWEVGANVNRPHVIVEFQKVTYKRGTIETPRKQHADLLSRLRDVR